MWPKHVPLETMPCAMTRPRRLYLYKPKNNATSISVTKSTYTELSLANIETANHISAPSQTLLHIVSRMTVLSILRMTFYLRNLPLLSDALFTRPPAFAFAKLHTAS